MLEVFDVVTWPVYLLSRGLIAYLAMTNWFIPIMRVPLRIIWLLMIIPASLLIYPALFIRKQIIWSRYSSEQQQSALGALCFECDHIIRSDTPWPDQQEMKRLMGRCTEVGIHARDVNDLIPLRVHARLVRR